MITNAILSFFLAIINVLLAPLEVINIAIDFVSSIPVVVNFLSFVWYIIPWSNLTPIVVAVIAILTFKATIALIKLTIHFIPGL